MALRRFDFLSGLEESDDEVGTPEAPVDNIPTKLKSQRGGERIGYKGHIYCSPSTLADDVTVAWRCKVNNACKCRVHTAGMNGGVIRVLETHNHLGDPVRIESERFKEAVKRKAGESLEKVQQILGTELATVSREVQEQGPSLAALRQTVYRERKAVLNAPTIPQTASAIDVPDAFAYYTTGNQREKFLLVDSGLNDENRILVFGRESVGAQLRHVSALFIDGTFQSTPPLFAQLLVIVGKRGEFAQPVFHALMPNRQEVTYDRLFTLIKEKYPELQPQSISVDYEAALINAAHTAFPAARLNGCYFHLWQIVIRNLKNGLKVLYESDIAINLEVRMLLAHAFVPLGKLLAYFDEFKRSADEQIVPLVEYFESNYVGSRRVVKSRSARGAMKTTIVYKQPRYPPKLWNLYRRYSDNDESTNNRVEGAHRRCQLHLNSVHPDIWRFIYAMQSVQRTFDFDYNQHFGGATPKKQRCGVLMRNKKILNVMEEFEIRTPLEYLRGIASCLSSD